MIKPDFDSTRIRKCELVTVDDQQMIQFIATGDRHKLMRMDDGSLEVVKLPEQGKDYRYGDPYTIDEALSILGEKSHENHESLAQKLSQYLKNN